MVEPEAVAALLTEPAFAKVNLTLQVIRRRADGYHDLDSLVVFAGLADAVTLALGSRLDLTLRGPTAASAGAVSDNLVLQAAEALAARIEWLQLGHFTLDKRLPVAAGLGGGSADAAAALRLIARANCIDLGDPRLFDAARATGADVPVCIDPRPRRMRGIGDSLSDPLEIPDLPAVLVNPGVSVPTKAVFAALRLDQTAAAVASEHSDDVPSDRAALLDYLEARTNDLEPVAIGLRPEIADVLGALRSITGCRLARMSGSGATCFGLFDTEQAAETAAAHLGRQHSPWWVRATLLGTPRHD